MGLPRLILLAIIIGGGLWLWRRFNNRSLNNSKHSKSQAMVRCVHCHVHIPQDRAYQQEHNWYCSAAHRKLGPKDRD